MTLSIRKCVLFLAILVDFLPVAFGQYSQHQPCLQTESSIVILRKDPQNGDLSIVERLEPGETLSRPGVQSRKLEEFNFDSQATDQHKFLRSEIDATPGLLVKDKDNWGAYQRLLEKGTDSKTPGDALAEKLYYAWECSCHSEHIGNIPTAYCPLDIETCLRPSRWMSMSERVPGCRNLPKAYDFRRYSFLFMVAWFVVLIASLVTSDLGPSMLGFLVTKFYPDWNEIAVDRLIQRRPDRVRQMIRIFVTRQQRALEAARLRMDTSQAAAAAAELQGGGISGGPTVAEEAAPEVCTETKRASSLLLKTTVYDCKDGAESKANGDDISSESDEDNCSICFASFVRGDPVGSLKCGHLFHKECIKIWLQRRNACPLCNLKGVAIARYDAFLPDMEEGLPHRVHETTDVNLSRSRAAESGESTTALSNNTDFTNP